MDWKKTKVTFFRWDSPSGHTITEDPNGEGFPFRLESFGADPEYFATLGQAQAVARLQNDLALTKADNDRLRAELTRLKAGDDWNDAPSSPAADDGRGIPPSSAALNDPAIAEDADDADVKAIAGKLAEVVAKNANKRPAVAVSP
jgi:hypothetical protein